MSYKTYLSNHTITIHELLDNGFCLSLQDYPIWDESHRCELNRKIIDHYRFYEIGFETPERFDFELRTKMHEIMPRMIKLFETTMYKYNPIWNADYTDKHTISRDRSETSKNDSTSSSTGSSSSTDNNTTSGTSKNVEVDPPQSALDVISKNIDSLTYASKITFDSSEGTSSGSGTTSTSMDGTASNKMDSSGKEEETFSKVLQGNYGVTTTQAMIQQERDIILDVDMKIIEELKDLFMLIY